jgi:methionyl-tRNA formyltransferase
MGTPDFSVGTLEAIVQAGHEIIGVVTQPDKPKGRGKCLTPTPVKAAALQLGLDVYQPEKVRHSDFVETLRRLQPDVIVVVAFGQIISKEILELPPLGCINVHASLLPSYRGAAPIQWAVINGETQSGITIMRMDEGLDTGDMIAKKAIPLDAKETGGSLFDKLSQMGAKLLVDTLPRLEDGTIDYEQQPKESPTSYAGMIKKQMGQLDFSKSAIELERWIRGLNPWPSAYTYVNGKSLKIWEASVVADISPQAPGRIVSGDEQGLWVQTGDGMLVITNLQLEGKKRMNAGAFLRGYHIETGTVLG